MPSERAVPSFYSAENYRAEESIGYLMRRILTAVGQSVEAQHVRARQPDLPAVGAAAQAAHGQGHHGGRTGARMPARHRRHDAPARPPRGQGPVPPRALAWPTAAWSTSNSPTKAAPPPRKCPYVLSRVQNEHLAGFSDEEWEQLKGYLRRILDNAQALAARGEKNDSTLFLSVPCARRGTAVAAAVAGAGCWPVAPTWPASARSASCAMPPSLGLAPRQRRRAATPTRRQPMVARLRRRAAQRADRPGAGRQPEPAGRAGPRWRARRPSVDVAGAGRPAAGRRAAST